MNDSNGTKTDTRNKMNVQGTTTGRWKSAAVLNEIRLKNKQKDLQIAPHEGRELEYVANGIKPLALLNRNKQPEQYGRAMDLQHVLVIRRQGNDEISITSKANEKLHDVYELLVSSRAAVVIRSAAEKHRMLGRLFGYSEEQIDAFIKADMKCACGQCSFNEPTTADEVAERESFT